MDRRQFMAGALGASALSLTAPLWSFKALAAIGAKTLRFVPNGDLSTFDPIGSTSYVVRNAALLVWDTLYGVDENQMPQRQMITSETVSNDGLTWTFILRDDLKFHDGNPVTATDAVASIKRWAARDTMGQMLLAIDNGLSAIDEKTFRWSLKSPFPKMLLALGKSNAPCAFIMPESIAKTDPMKLITEFVGSGPMKFVNAEWVPGSKAVFEKFTDYKPRSEPASWMAGNKTVDFDRIEWVILSDAASAAMALQNGEIDWLEAPLMDLVPILKSNSDISVGVSNPQGNVGGIRLNHLQPPFTDVRARTALMMAVNQDDYMNTMMGEDRAMWKHMYGFFTPGTPLYNEFGSEVMKKPRDYGAAKALLAESGYKNEPIVLMVAQERTSDKALAEVTADLLTNKLGMNLDLVGTDFGTIQKRRQLRTPAKDGGWHMFFVGHSGTDCANPAAYIGLRGNGDKAWFGWPSSPDVEAGINDWFNVGSGDAELEVAKRINAAAVRDVMFVPTGFYLPYQAWRNTLTGVVPAPFPMFWGVKKAV